MRSIWAIILAGILASGGARAGSVKLVYTGMPLSVASEGGLTGVKRVKLIFSLPAAPAPGTCVTTRKLLQYSDGHNTLKTLKAAGFRFASGGGGDASSGAPSASICTDPTTGAVVSGSYQMALYYSNSVVSDIFEATNEFGSSFDTVELQEYLGGDAPQIYSDVSSAPGSWTIM